MLQCVSAGQNDSAFMDWDRSEYMLECNGSALIYRKSNGSKILMGKLKWW